MMSEYIGVNFTPSEVPNKYRFAGRTPGTIIQFVVPNKVLLHLNSLSKGDVLTAFNELIYARAVNVKSTANPFLESLIKSASSIRAKHKKATGGTPKAKILASSTKIYALLEEVDTYGALEKQVYAQEAKLQKLNAKLQETSAKLRDTEKVSSKLASNLRDAEQAAQVLISKNEKLQKFVTNILKHPRHTGKKLVGDCQRETQVKKLALLKSPAEQALKFAEAFGLKLDKVIFEDLKGKKHEISYQEVLKKSCGYNDMTEDEQARVQGILYICDKFGISDDGYHALSMAIGGDIDKSYIIKQCKKSLDSFCAVTPTPGPVIGAQHDFMSELDRLIADTECSDNDLLKIRLSGDGTKLSKTINFLNFSMGLLQPTGPIPAASGEEGNRTLAVVQTTESYQNIKTALSDQIEAVNHLQSTRNSDNIVHYVTSSGKPVRLQLSLSGDMKFLPIVLGMNAANSKYACMYCLIPKTERWIMSRYRSFYYMAKLRRTLANMKAHSAKTKGETFGMNHPPLFDIPLDWVVVDELHLLLRITDILTDNLLLEAEQFFRHNKLALEQCEEFFKSCGVSFKIWQNQKSKQLEWTSLSGNEKKKLLKTLPDKLLAHSVPCFHDDTRIQISKLWADFSTLYFQYINSSTVTSDMCTKFHVLAKQWINDFIAVGAKREGYSKSDITPYMHVMVYHLPYLMAFHSSLKPFTGQGLEKVNDDLKMIYYKRCNKKFAAEQTLRCRFRKSLTRKHKPVKRCYVRKQKVPD